MNLAEQVVLITGGAGSIGRRLAGDLAADAKRVIALDADRARLDELEREIGSVGCYACDLADGDQVASVVESVYSQEPEITVLVNAAGAIHSEPLVRLAGEGERRHDFARWREVIDANLTSTFFVTACVAERMALRRTKGLIVSMSSVAAAGNAGQSAYAAAKAGVNALTVTWSRELGPVGIRCAAIAPGFIDTPSTHEALTEAQLKRWKRSVPLGRLGEVEEVIRAVRFIIGNDFFNGRILELDGGLRI